MEKTQSKPASSGRSRAVPPQNGVALAGVGAGVGTGVAEAGGVFVAGTVAVEFGGGSVKVESGAGVSVTTCGAEVGVAVKIKKS